MLKRRVCRSIEMLRCKEGALRKDSELSQTSMVPAG